MSFCRVLSVKSAESRHIVAFLTGFHQKFSLGYYLLLWSQKNLNNKKQLIDMAITRYNPLNDFIPSTFGSLVENMLNDQVSNEKVYMPAVDIMRDEDKLTLFVSAPGMNKENFSRPRWRSTQRWCTASTSRLDELFNNCGR